MAELSTEEQKTSNLYLLSAIGSTASLAALVIVLVDKIATNAEIEPQMLVWRIAFSFVSLIFAGSIVLITYHQTTIAWKRYDESLPSRVLKSSGFLVLGFISLAASLDAVFAELYWEVVFYDIVNWLTHLLF